MRYLPVLMVLFSLAAFAQAPVHMPALNENESAGHGALSLQNNDDERLPFSHEGLDGEGRTILPTGVVSSIGIGAMARMNAASSGLSKIQLSTGYIELRQGAQSNLEGNGAFASIVPVFVGSRNDIAELKSGRLVWTQYVAYGAGPVVGIAHPTAYSLWQTVSRMSFRWGAGAYAGVGSELRFSQGMGMYAQLEYTAFGFTAPLRGKQSFLGPSFSFGILLVP